MNRRDFIKASALSGLGSLTLLDGAKQGLAATSVSDYKSLVFLYLDGGNDSFNMLIPNTSAEYNAYRESRQSFAFDQSALQTISPVGLGSDSFGLHPNMAGMRSLFNNRELSFVANAGPLIKPTSKSDILNGAADLPSGLSSHSNFRSYWKADHDNAPNTTRDGFGGRLTNEFLNTSSIPISISSGSGYDLFVDHSENAFYDLANGLVKIVDYDLATGNVFNRLPARSRRAALDAINAGARGSENLLVQHAANVFSDGLDLSLEVQRLIENIPPTGVQFPRSGVASRLRRAAELIAVRQELKMNRQVIFIRMSGFDTHSNQQATHNGLMLQLDQALSTFRSALNSLGVEDSVLTYTGSEFGRTLTNNGDGTDHAWGGNQIIMGGGVKGGEIFGDYPVLELDGEDDYNGDGRFIPTTSVTQLLSSLASWFGVPQNRLISVLPNLVNFSQQPSLDIFS